jgi:hypothetical protein
MATRTVREKRLFVEEEETVWLYALLADIRRDVRSQPKRQAIERIRARIQAAMDRPVRQAA